MSMRQTATVLAAATLCAVAVSGPASAQENCGFMYQRVMEAYQVQSPYYGRMVQHYNARCLSGGSYQPNWRGGHNHYRYDQDRRGYDNERPRLGW